MHRILLAAAIFAALLPALSIAQQERTALHMGDAAPTWTVDTWLHGEPVAELASGTAYYVEFWATWCVPCIQSFPELTALQRAHPELVVVAVSIDREKGAEELGEFAATQVAQGRVGFRLAWDSTHRMAKSWLNSAGLSAVPSALIVGSDGRIAYIGHSRGANDAAPRILAGDWDIDQARRERQARRGRALARHQAAQAMHDRFLAACEGARWDEANRALDEIEAQEGYVVGYDQDRLCALLRDGNRVAAFHLADRRARRSWNEDANMLGIIVQSYAFHARGLLDGDERALVWRCVSLASLCTGNAVSQRALVALAYAATGELDEACRLQRQVVAAAERGEGPAEQRERINEFFRDRLALFEQKAAARK